MKSVLLVGAVLASGSCALGDSLNATAVKLGKQASTALAHKDIGAFAAVMKLHVTKNFKFVDQGQAMSFKQMVAGMKEGLAGMNVTGSQTLVTRCVERGKSGSTTMTHKLFGTMTGPDHKKHKLVATGTSHDTWVKAGKSWMMSVMNWGDNKVTLDGKPFNPMVGGAKQVRAAPAAK